MIRTFVTPTGILVPAVTTRQMSEVDRIAMEETGPNLFQMMENAGRNLALTAMEEMGAGWREACYLVLAGSGGNGGGGICAARHLANRNLKVFLCLTRPQVLNEVAAFQYLIYQNSGGEEISVDKLGNIQADLIVDAVVGYSLAGALRGTALEAVRWANGQQSVKVALDVPSGLNATTGKAAGELFQPDVTLTLALPKTGLLPERTGRLLLADIGLPSTIFQKMHLNYCPPFGTSFRVPLTVPDEP